MHTTLSDEQIQRYQSDGFLVIEQLLEPDELARWREVVVTATDEMDRASKAAGANSDATADMAPAARAHMEGMRSQFTRYSNVARADAKVRDLIDDDDLKTMVRTLIGTAQASYAGDQAMYKEPWALPTFFHYDASAPGWKDVDGTKALTLWVALEDATVENGCLVYVPGSHLLHDVTPTPGDQVGRIFERNPGLADLGTVACPVPAGGAVMHNGNTVHGSAANVTNSARMAFSFSTWGA